VGLVQLNEFSSTRQASTFECRFIFFYITGNDVSAKV
jgi:hypothetical protein